MQKNDQNVEIVIKKSSFIDILLIFARNKALLLKVIILFTVFGILVALISPKKYTSTAKLIPDIDSETNVGMSRLAAISRSFGFDFGSSIQGITGEIYPDIISSRNVVYDVVTDSFYLNTKNTRIIFVEYIKSNKSLLSKISDVVLYIPRKVFSTGTTEENSEGRFFKYTLDELTAMETLSISMLRMNMDLKKGVLEIAITSNHPELSTQLLESFIRHLINRIQYLFTEKTTRNYEFLKARYQQSEKDLNEAEKKLADFLDQNIDPNNARLKIEQERLERKVTFKAELYSEIQKELTKAEIDLQKSKPVLTVLESPAIPIKPSHPKKILMVITFFLIGIILALGITLFTNYLENLQKNEPDSIKIKEIKSNLQFKKFFPMKSVFKSK